MSFFLKKFWKRDLKQEDIARQFIQTFQTDSGLVVLHYLANKYHVLTPHDGNPYNEGQRSVVLDALRYANFTADDFTLLSRTGGAQNTGDGLDD